MEQKQHIYYIINRLDEDADIDGLHLLSGYYKFTYDLSGEDLPNAAEFSTDRCNWTDCPLYSSLSEYQEIFNKVENKMVIESEEYVETVCYKGKHVPIFLDDYGQCFYCIYDNDVIGFGSFQDNYEDEVKGLIDCEERKKRK